jgi:hypothetical protein
VKWKLVARMRVHRGATTVPYRGQQPTWIEIRLGPKRELRCSCVAGGRAVDLPSGVGDSFGTGYIAIGTCNHIEALYRGHVTEDKRKAAGGKLAHALNVLSTGKPVEPPRLIQLTQLGEQMFRWRWAQMALERST